MGTPKAPRRLSGPRKLYRHVGTTPITTKLTPDATKILTDTCTRTKLKRGDVFEFLLRKFAHRIPDDLLDKQQASEKSKAAGPAADAT